MQYEEAVEFVTWAVSHGTELGLDSVKELLQKLGNPEKGLKMIHVAGTNGKGSTCAMIAGILRKAGYRTGLFTSPYLHDLWEYLNIDGTYASEEEYAKLASSCIEAAGALADKLSEFEWSVGMALKYFADAKCDIVVMEVGLGGRMDATNVIECPELAVIVNIGIDHTGFLGDTLEEIAAEKAGIIKRGCEVVSYEQVPEVTGILLEKAEKEHAALTFPDFGKIQLLQESLEGQIFSYKEWEEINLALLGGHQRKNAAVVLECVGVLRKRGFKIPMGAVRDALIETHWPGRFELLMKNPVVLADGGHNEQCIKELVQAFDQYIPGKKIVFVTGVMADKEYSRMYDLLAPYAKCFYAVEPRNPRALKSNELADFLKCYSVPVTECHSVEDGVRQAVQEAGKEGVVIAVGSLYMMSDVRSVFG